MVSVANILMNRTRSRLVRFLIARGSASSNEVAEALGVARSTVRRHVALLVEAGIISGTTTLSVERNQVRKQLAELEAAFHAAGSDLTNRWTESSHFSVSPFHSKE